MHKVAPIVAADFNQTIIGKIQQGRAIVERLEFDLERVVVPNHLALALAPPTGSKCVV